MKEGPIYLPQLTLETLLKKGYKRISSGQFQEILPIECKVIM